MNKMHTKSSIQSAFHVSGASTKLARTTDHAKLTMPSKDQLTKLKEQASKNLKDAHTKDRRIALAR